MGFAKYYEDNNEIMIGRMERNQRLSIPRQSIQYYACPYCNQIEYSQDKLFEHIKKEHNITHPVIVVNGKVINQNEFSLATIDSLNIFTYGFADEIILEQKSYHCSEKGNIDLTQVAKEVFETNNSLQIDVGDKRLLIKRYSIKEVRIELINPVIREWEKAITEGIMITPDLPSVLNEIEIEYLKGFYNYFVACLSNGVDKRDRYYDAYNILQGFNPISSLGICVLKAIAFRFNWIESLRQLCNLANDDFNVVCNFYDGASNESLKFNIIEQQNSLYIEDDVRECVDAINNYMFGYLSEVETYIEKHNIDYIADENLKDRVLVLLCRMALTSNNEGKARYYNDKILTPDLKNIY